MGVLDSFVTTVRIASGGTEGPCPRRNRAIRDCPTPWIFLLDSDAVPAPACLEELWRAVCLHHEVSVGSPRILNREGKVRIEYDGGRAHFLGEMCLENRGRLPEHALPATRWPSAVSSSALLIRCGDALRTGLFDPRLYIFKDDLDFSLRFRALGFKILHVPEAVVYHDRWREVPGGRPLHCRRRYLQVRNRWWVLLKVLEGRTLLKTLPLQLLYEVLNLIRSLWCGELVQCLKAYRDVVRELPEIFRSRREVQSVRILSDREILSSPPLDWSAGALSVPGARSLRVGFEGLCGVWWRLVTP